MALTVTSYRLSYNLNENQFMFLFKVEGDYPLERIPVSPEVCLALADMFRNEGPVKFYPEDRRFVTGPEPVGEGEPAQP